MGRRGLLRFLVFAVLLGGAVSLMGVAVIDPPSCNPVPVQCTEGQPCDDWDACTEGEMCIEGVCNYGNSVDCGDSDVCTEDMCDSIEGCYWTPVDCSDELECSLDDCDPAAGCWHDYTPCNPALMLPHMLSQAIVPFPWPEVPVERCVMNEFTLEGFAAVASIPPGVPGPVRLYIADIVGGPALYLWTQPGGDPSMLVCEVPLAPWDPQAGRMMWMVDLAQFGIHPLMEWHHYACGGIAATGEVYMWVDGMPIPVAPMQPVFPDPARPAIMMGHFNDFGIADLTEVPGWIDGVRLSELLLYPPMSMFPPPPTRWSDPLPEACVLWNFTYAPGTTEMPDEIVGLPLLGLDASVEIPGDPPLPYMPPI